MLNEAPAGERTAAQGAIALFTSVGQLISSVLVGAVAGSYGGTQGYSSAYLVIAAVAGVLLVLALGLKSRAEELRTAGVRLTQPASTTAEIEQA